MLGTCCRERSSNGPQDQDIAGNPACHQMPFLHSDVSLSTSIYPINPSFLSGRPSSGKLFIDSLGYDLSSRFESQPKDDQCFERLRTVDHGWPANFKYCPPIVRSMRPCEKDKGLAEVPFDMINQTSYPDFVTEEPVTTRSP